MSPFITGSHAYGIPTEKSDVDLVIPPLDEEHLLLLQSISTGEGVLRFGNLNLIVAPTEEAFRLWKKCNDELVKMKPVPREFAIKYLETKFKYAGVDRFLCNSGE